MFSLPLFTLSNFGLRLFPYKNKDMRRAPYIFLSGAASNVDKNNCSFDLCVTQYMSHFHDDRDLSILPVHTHFNSPKFKNNKPRTKENHDVGLLGILDDINTELSGEASVFHVAVDTINFIQPVNVQSSKTKKGFRSSFFPLSVFLTISALQGILQPILALNLTLITFLRLHLYLLHLPDLAFLLHRLLLERPAHLLELTLQSRNKSSCSVQLKSFHLVVQEN